MDHKKGEEPALRATFDDPLRHGLKGLRQALGQDLSGESGPGSQGHARHPRLLQKVSSVYPCRRI